MSEGKKAGNRREGKNSLLLRLSLPFFGGVEKGPLKPESHSMELLHEMQGTRSTVGQLKAVSY